MTQLLGDDDLARSPVVANCRMNRERGLTGTNGYGVALGLAPLDFLREQAQTTGRDVAWLDLCCGSGRALIEAAQVAERTSIAIVGVDLVGLGWPRGSDLPRRLRLVEACLSRWAPDRSFDLITCVHGLHYVGDKLGLIERAASWLTADGLFVAHLDLANLRLDDEQPANRHFAASFRRAGLDYLTRRRLIRCEGHRSVHLPYQYLGADDNAGANSTGQPAVNSIYERT